MVPHRPASPAEPTPLQYMPATAGIIDLEGHTKPSFLPYPGKGLTVDVRCMLVDNVQICSLS
jgi:hypothetical protein